MIVIADDSISVRKFVGRMLEKNGYRVKLAADGLEAAELVTQHGCHLVITDLVMPEQEGVETVRALRKELPGLGIIAMSGGFGAHFLKVAVALGANAVLCKPVEAEDLVNRVAEPDACLSEALILARSLAKCAPHAVETTKRLIDEASGRPSDLRGAAAISAAVRVSEEALEGMRAFLGKRTPKWASGSR